MSDPVIKIQNLSIILGKDLKAIDSINLKLEQGKIIGFIGPSGAGKTTLIRCIVGRQKITNGEVLVLGNPAGSSKLRQHINYMPQEAAAYSDLTVSENLRYFATVFGIDRKEINTMVEQILQSIDLVNQANQLVESLSGGQKQRVSLAIALIGQPKLMVLDEPTIGLDPVLREQLWGLFHKLAKSGTTLIISSHVMDEAERCDDLVLIRDGKLLAHNSPAKLREKTNTNSVEQSFLKLVGTSL
jgi:ABC-2 type transport system ATP-binding protein